MGNGQSQQQQGEGEDGQSKKVFDTRCISFDEDGNLRLGAPPLRCGCSWRLG